MKKLNLLSLLTILILGTAFNSFAQSVNVSGQIRDAGDGEPMIGTNVVEVDANGRYLNGTITDFNGNYIIKVSSGQATVQVSMLGYKKQLIKIAGRSKINIKLESTSTQLDDIVISGEKIGNDGVTAIRDRGVAVSRIELKELSSSMTTSVEEMLQGRMGNVDIMSASGDPGAGLNIRIRGTATLNARNTPLIVVNGIPYDTDVDGFDFGSADAEKFGSLIDVAPEDIESIEVLKDAGSTAIWGSKAANGVLMIKTKRGTRSKPIFEYTFKFTTANEPDPVPMLDGGGYSMLIAESHYNLIERNNFFQTNDDAIEIAYDKDWEEYWNYAQNTNWIDEITRVAFTQQHHFSVRGGGEKSMYKVAVGYQNEEGTTVGTNLKKININTSFDYQISSKLKFQSDIMYTHYDQDASYDYEDWYYTDNRSLRSMAYRKMPNLSVYTRDTLNNVYEDYFTPEETLQGNAVEIPNPVAFANLATQKRYKDNVRAGFTLNYKITDKLTANNIITLDVFDSKMEKFLPYKAIGAYYDGNATRRATSEFTNKSSIFNMTKLIYRPFESTIHDVSFLGQFDVEMTKTRAYSTVTSNSFSEFDDVSFGNKENPWFEAWFSEYKSIGFFLNANYKFKDKYIVSLNAKYEGNSKYSAESRWGLFPAASLAWRISEEAFLKNVSMINDFRIRGSWGKTGNAPTDNYLYFNTYSAGVGYGYMDLTPGFRPNGMELTDLRWETIEQYNLGFSFYAIRNRLNIEFDVYQKTTHDLFLLDTRIPSSTGFYKYNTNDGELQNKGIEAMIDYKVIDKPDFKFSFNVNIAHNQNMVLQLPESYDSRDGDPEINGEDGYVTEMVPGYAMGGFYGYTFLGTYSTLEDTYVRDANGDLIYEPGETTPMRMIHTEGTEVYFFQPGDSKYDDRNHDGKIDELDIVYLGDTNPLITGGFGPRIQYKNLSINFHFYFRVGYEIINGTRMVTENMYGYDNQSTATNWRWRTEGDETDMPRALHDDGYNWLGSSRFVEDGSFMRLKSTSLSYDIPKKWTKKINFKDMKVYVTGYNLYTWTNYSGQDPEVSFPARPDDLPIDYSRTPPSLRFIFGFSATF